MHAFTCSDGVATHYRSGFSCWGYSERRRHPATGEVRAAPEYDAGMKPAMPKTLSQSRAPNSIRFGAQDATSGLCSETWKVWISKTTRDVYLVCRAIGQHVKLSLHESGRWHFAYQNPDIFDDETRPDTRFVGVYERPLLSVGKPTLAVRIHIPWFAATLKAPEDVKEIVWMTPAEKGESIEVALFLFDSGTRPFDDWPGKSSMGTQFVGAVDFMDGGAVVLVRHTVPILGIPEQPAKQTFFKGQTSADLDALGLRMVAWGRDIDGSLVIMEMPIQIERL